MKKQSIVLTFIFFLVQMPVFHLRSDPGSEHHRRHPGSGNR